MKHKTEKRFGKKCRLFAFLCLFAAVLLSFNGCLSGEGNQPEVDTLAPTTYESRWTVESSGTKSSVGTGGRTFTATISQKNRMTSPLPQHEADETVCLELCADLMLSILSFDYPLHFSLFAPQQVAVFERDELIPRGFSLQEAKLHIEEIFWEAVGLRDFHLDLSVVDVTFDDPETVEEFRKYRENEFAEWGMDIDKIDCYAACRFDRASVKIHDTLEYGNFLNDFESDTIILYRYGGVWYVEPKLFDDDVSIDFAESQKGETPDYCKEQTGTVTLIKNQLIFIDNALVSPLNDACKELSVGDRVTVQYYTMGIEFDSMASASEFDGGVRVGVIFDTAEPSLPVVTP